MVVAGLSATAQIKENVVRAKTLTTPFLEKYLPTQLIRFDSALYALTHTTLVGQSLKTAIDSGWVYRVGDGGGDIDTTEWNMATKLWVQDNYEPFITAGTTGQYWRGDKTWQTLPSASQWTTEPDGIYYNGKVGIGVTNPTSTDSTLQGVSASFTRGVRIDKKLIVKTMPVIIGNADTTVVWNANDSSFARQAIGDCSEGVRIQSFVATAGQTSFTVTLFTANDYYTPIVDYNMQSQSVIQRTGNTFTYAPGLREGQTLTIMN